MARTLGRYELVEPIGRGGMAEVFLARRRGPAQVEKRLVIKRIRRERIRDPRFIEMFVEEARLSMALAHKNIVPMFDFGRAGDELFLVMEYVDGVDLGAVLSWMRERGSTLAPMLVAYIGLEACQALDYAHHLPGHAGIVHRDITPGNVLLSVMGEVKLVDFGVAAVISDGSSDSRVRGTPAYMAPEQAAGEPVDGRADLFALGLLLWEALSGQRAYAGRDPAQVLATAKAGQVPALSGAVPDALRAIIAKATAAQVLERYADARAMQLAFDEFLVAARAKAGGAPPSHELAALVAEVKAGRRLVVEEIRPPTAPAVSYADDGGDKLHSALFDEAGGATMRSMAATVAETLTEEAEAGKGSGEESREEDTAGHTAKGSKVRRDIDTAGAEQVEAAHLSAARARQVGQESARARRRAALAVLLLAGVAAAVLVIPSTRGREHIPLQAVAPVVTHAAQPGAISGAADEPAAPEELPVSGQPPEPAPDRLSERDPGPAAVAERASRPRVAVQRRPDGPAEPDGLAEDDNAGQPKQPAAPKAEQAQLGTVKVSATPWAQVSVEGHSASCPETPCVLRLPAGSYTLRLVNPVAQFRKELTVTVHSDKTVVVSTTLTASE